MHKDIKRIVAFNNVAYIDVIKLKSSNFVNPAFSFANVTNKNTNTINNNNLNVQEASGQLPPIALSQD